MHSTETPNREKEMIPRTLLLGMAALALSSLALVSYSVATGRSHVGVPDAGTVTARTQIVLEGLSAQAVIVKRPDGTVLADLPHGGFITVIQSGMARERLVHHVQGNPPIDIVRYDNGRLVAEDPATGWSAELYAFGSDNRAAFERLLQQSGE
ncbi:photosynthetic complex assembly protein PuhC [Paragemmobacter straminiformis]|uniref:Photosynthetic complex assembly protein n=1 Tax=Paragemmobacter straminiformis TaxID=2045119 RepID=A0A842IAI8_9RHOB|nr:photosynthetic complex assembly protein PuhC [Gemmobacter straminiformis]MBC2836609.1 photosynthetic complex assembly protein [Gemmobacter straminiformis]